MNSLVLCLLLGQLSDPVWGTRDRAENTLRSHRFSVAQWQALRVARFSEPEVAVRAKVITAHWTGRLLDSEASLLFPVWPDIDYATNWPRDGKPYFEAEPVFYPDTVLHRPETTYVAGDHCYVYSRQCTRAACMRFLVATGDMATVKSELTNLNLRSFTQGHATFKLLGIGGLQRVYQGARFTPQLCPQVFLPNPSTREVFK